MLVPFALAIGLGMTLGIIGAPVLLALATAAACAALYMWNTRSAKAGGAPAHVLAAALITDAGLLILMCVVAGGGYLLGRFFGWARLDA